MARRRRRDPAAASPTATEPAAAPAPAPAAPEEPRRSGRSRKKTEKAAAPAEPAPRRKPAAKKKSGTSNERYGVPQLGDKYDKMSGPVARNECKEKGLIQSGTLKDLVGRLRDPKRKDFARGSEAKKKRRAPGGLEEGAPVEDVPVVPTGRRPAQGATDGSKKPRAAVAVPRETEADAWKYVRDYSPGLLEHVANFDTSSGEDVKVICVIVGAKSSSKRPGAQKAALNVKNKGERPVIVYAGGADAASPRVSAYRD